MKRTTSARVQMDLRIGIEPHQSCQLSQGDPCKACANVLELELQISEKTNQHVLYEDLELELRELFSRRRQLRTEMNRIHNPTVLQVPTEIASYIFQLCMPYLHFGSGPDNVELWKQPAKLLNLCAVCREWRAIACSTPLLWTIIRVQLNFYDTPWLLNFTQAWFGRSGKLPLFIHVNHSRYHSGIEHEKFAGLIDLVNHYSDRWRHLELDVPSSLLSKLCGRPGSSSILQVLRIQPTDLLGPARFELADILPQPTDVSLTSIRLDSVIINWGLLTVADITHFTLDECIRFLQLAQQLIRCNFSRIIPARAGTSMSYYVITHSRLEELEFSGLGELLWDPIVDTSPFFDRFRFASLRKLRFTSFNNHLPVDAVISLLQRSRCNLHELCIENADIRYIPLLTILEHTPCLEVLGIAPLPAEEDFPREFFSLMCRTQIWPPEDDNPFLPYLHTLKYHFGLQFLSGNRWEVGNGLIPWCCIMDLVDPPLARMLSRGPVRFTKRPLQALHISFASGPVLSDDLFVPEHYLPRLLQVLQEGMDFRLLTKMRI